MTSSIRDFTNFAEFPGEIKDTGYHSFPLLWHLDDFKRWRQWQIHVRLIKKPAETLSGIDWNLLEEKQVSIKPTYYAVGSKISPNITAQVWAETGIEGSKITQNAPTYYFEPLNLGKANERNVFQTALVYARSQWLKRKEKGGAETKLAEGKTPRNTNVMFFPMLAKAFKDGKKHLKFPLYIQPKLDGVRCLVFLSKKNGGVKSVVAYTRSKKVFPSVEYIKKTLYPYLNALYDDTNNQSIYLDGELYRHGKKLQDISGDSRNEAADVDSSNTSRNEYHVYDCFYPKELETTFEERYKQLSAFYEALEEADSSVIKEVPTVLVNSMKEAQKKYVHFTKMGYEGAILRNTAGPYLANAQKTGPFLRSNDLVKLKQKFTDEYEIIGYTEGSKGKDKGAMIWVCKTPSGEEFNVTPKDMTYAERYELFEDAEKSFDEKYLGALLTVEYEDLSRLGVPLRAKALVIRDYE
jgi:DNA ligase-1